MIIGMLPMALAFGEGGEQNAPLGRAVIGGLLVATIGTLFIVPIFYSMLRKTAPINYDEKIDKEYRGEITPDGKPVERQQPEQQGGLQGQQA
jgi:H+/gluconate symporter-like permease